MFDPTITIGNIVAAVAFVASAAGAVAIVRLRLVELTEAMKETAEKFEIIHSKGCNWGQLSQQNMAKHVQDHSEELRKTANDRERLAEMANDIKWIKHKLDQL